MKLDKKGLENREEWEAAGFRLPQYNREKAAREGRENPVWIHFGAGNFFRAFPAAIVQEMLDAGEMDAGVIMAEGVDYDLIKKISRPHDDYSILVTREADGKVEKTVIGSIAQSCILDAKDEKEFERLKEIFRRDSLQMATFTITEKGYSLVDGEGTLQKEVEADFKNGPKEPESFMGKAAALMYERYKNGRKPLSLVSLDNCSHNGEKLYAAMYAYAENWMENGFMDEGFMEYLRTEEIVSFPWTMVDKITPQPDVSVEEILSRDGVRGMDILVTKRETCAAPFVNAERFGCMVVEDEFPNGRPKLEKAGVIFTDRDTVERAEKMKISTCLNPLQTTLAIFGRLLGYQKISDEMNDPELKRLVELVGYAEGLPVVADPGIIAPVEYLDHIVKERLCNPFLSDSPKWVLTDTSQKIPLRFGTTIKKYLESPELEVEDLKTIPLVLAGWLRYLMGVDDEGKSFELSPDPQLDLLCPYVSDFRLGKVEDVEEQLSPLLENGRIFGVNLCELGLSRRICGYFREMAAGKGAVRYTLKKQIGLAK